MKILLVDDSGTMRQIQKRMLEGLGITEILEAADGFQAVRMATEQKPDLVLMDWNMPNLSGIDALRKLKASPAAKGIPVIMVTSETERNHILEAVQAGASNYVVKPFTQEVIKDKLDPYLKQHGIGAWKAVPAEPNAAAQPAPESPAPGTPPAAEAKT